MTEKLSLKKKLTLEIYRGLLNDYRKEHVLRHLFWECTLRCNLHCRHCGSDCKTTSGISDMPFEDFAKVLDIVNAHTEPHSVLVIISGGEPLMRPDLAECGRRIHAKGFPWGIVSNAFALSREKLDDLLAAGMGSISVSLDGLKESHDWMRGREGSFDKVASALKMLAGSDVVFDVVTCVNRRNITELAEIKEFLIASGVTDWRIFTVFPMGRAANDPDMHLTGAQMREVLDFIKATRREGRIKCEYACEGFLGNYEGEVRDGLFNCRAGISNASVLADGSISACTSIRANYTQGNIYKDDFWDVWTNRFLPYRDRSWMKKDDCGDCRYFKYCLGGGMHLRDNDGKLLLCHLKKIVFLPPLPDKG